MQILKTKPWRSKKYLDFIRSQPCTLGGGQGDIVPCHYRRAYNSGTGTKPSDYYTIPLANSYHHEWHNIGNDSFFEQYDIDIYKEMFLLVSKYLKGDV